MVSTREQRISGKDGPASDLMVGMTAELEVLKNSARRLQTAGITRPVILLGQARTQTKDREKIARILSCCCRFYERKQVGVTRGVTRVTFAYHMCFFFFMF